jgi:hypothetical protein
MQTIVVDETIRPPYREATVELPAGWYRVLSGALKPGDRCLAAGIFWEFGAVYWNELTEFPPPGALFSTAEGYVCLIRRGEPVEALCPRCHVAAIRRGYRFCWSCCNAIASEIRRPERRVGRKPSRIS